MSYDYELILVNPGGIIEDDLGNQIPVEPSTLPVLCRLQSVGRNEFYNAAANGMRPEMVFIIHALEYSGQQVVKYNGITYRVIRTYQTDTEEIELTCERVTADG